MCVRDLLRSVTFTPLPRSNDSTVQRFNGSPAFAKATARQADVTNLESRSSFVRPALTARRDHRPQPNQHRSLHSRLRVERYKSPARALPQFRIRDYL
jgi:hypothetical protein